jgi:TatD DNase family protein
MSYAPDTTSEALPMLSAAELPSRASTPSHEINWPNATLDLSIIEPDLVEMPWFCQLAEAYPSDSDASLANGDDENALVIDSLDMDDHSELALVTSKESTGTAKKQVCPACGLATSTKQRHMKSHLPGYVIPNLCCWECGYFIRQTTKFEQHSTFYGCSPAGKYTPNTNLLEWAQLMTGLLARICYLLGIPGIPALLEYVKSHANLHPDPIRTTFDEHDKDWIQLFEAFNGMPQSLEEPQLDPPNRIGLLTHWRVVFNLLLELPCQERDLLRKYRCLYDSHGYPVATTGQRISSPIYGADAHFHHEKIISRVRSSWEQFNWQSTRDPIVLLSLAVTCYAYPESWPKVDVNNPVIQTLTQQTEPTIMVTVGWHPTRCRDLSTANLNTFTELLQMPWCVGAGEVGLDYVRGRTEQDRIAQRNLLWKILPAVIAARLPLVLHCRDAAEEEISVHRDCVAILERVLPRMWPVYVHCFNGGIGDAELWMHAFPMVRFGISPILLQSRAHPELRSVIERSNGYRLLLESDAPYFLKDVTKFPSSIVAVGQELARLHRIPVSQVFKSAEEATKMFYRPVPLPE